MTTDLDDPPAFGPGGPGPYPEHLKAQVRRRYPDLGPLRVDLPPLATYTRALAVARRQARWTITRQAAETGRFEGVALTPLLRFRDDFVIRVRRDGTGARVDMRSRSRLGKSDLGANARRIRCFFEALRAELGM